MKPSCRSMTHPLCALWRCLDDTQEKLPNDSSRWPQVALLLPPLWQWASLSVGAGWHLNASVSHEPMSNTDEWQATTLVGTAPTAPPENGSTRLAVHSGGRRSHAPCCWLNQAALHTTQTWKTDRPVTTGLDLCSWLEKLNQYPPWQAVSWGLPQQHFKDFLCWWLSCRQNQ